MNLKQRLSALELTKQVKPVSPIIIIVDDEITDSQRLTIANAKKRGQLVIFITKDT
jgi:glycerol-3-phosphate dehydrogenase